MSANGPGGGPGSEGRAKAMADSLQRATRAAGLDRASTTLIRRAHDLAMVPRVASLADDHHPAYLHPGRTALVLLRDVGPLGAEALAVACLLESEDADLRVPIVRVEEPLGTVVADNLRAVPSPGDAELVERLVGLPRELGLAVLAERLDQVRHLHLRDDLCSEWAERHEEVLGVWLPLAERTRTRLAVRFAHWARTFSKRL